MADAPVGQGTHRPASLRSVASSSSVGSSVNLTRRARTKTRPKTAGSSGRADQRPESPISELPYINPRFVLESSGGLPSTGIPPRFSRRSHSEALEVRNKDTPIESEARVAIPDDLPEVSQSPPMTPRLVRIRTFSCVTRAHVAVVVEATKKHFWCTTPADCNSARTSPVGLFSRPFSQTHKCFRSERTGFGIHSWHSVFTLSFNHIYHFWARLSPFSTFNDRS
jgi:hypothetical protein